MIRVALVRGKHLNPYEAQSYYSMTPAVKITAFCSLTSMPARYPFNVRRLPSPADISFSNRYSMAVLNRMFVDAHCLFGLQKNVRGFDIAHAADTYYGFTWQCIQAKRKGYVKKVVATVWENIPFANEGIGGRTQRKQQVLREVDKFLAVSHDAQRALIKEGCDPHKICVIYPGVDIKRFHPRATSGDPSTFTILFVGRLVPEKGIWVLWKAFSQLKKKYPYIRLIFCGKGADEKKLTALGATVMSSSYDILPEVYRNADCCVMPSLETPTWKEQFGMVIPEALASGLPMVATRAGSIPEVLGNAGLLVNQGNSNMLCTAIERYITSRSLCNQYQKKARQRATTVFDSRQESKKVYSVYRDVLSQP